MVEASDLKARPCCGMEDLFAKHLSKGVLQVASCEHSWRLERARTPSQRVPVEQFCTGLLLLLLLLLQRTLRRAEARPRDGAIYLSILVTSMRSTARYRLSTSQARQHPSHLHIAHRLLHRWAIYTSAWTCASRRFDCAYLRRLQVTKQEIDVCLL